MNKHESVPKTKPADAHVVAVFKSNRSQAIRIPKAIAFPESVKQVEILEVDGGLLIRPVRNAWDEFFARRTGLSDDFPAEIEDYPPDDVPEL